MQKKDNTLESFTKENNMITLTRRPLSQMEMIDLMIYGEDVVTNETDQINTKIRFIKLHQKLSSIFHRLFLQLF